ncbi:UNVERIFIED_CONTAM: Preprotein translocase subunit SECE1 [Sesamum calycinum]|uniref:Preprotein translocase subunit SECE1 n=1 Tax=Sesamum calycinum TaxID=2727403 RepID=A0AAW2JHX6_9LAMI
MALSSHNSHFAPPQQSSLAQTPSNSPLQQNPQPYSPKTPETFAICTKAQEIQCYPKSLQRDESRENPSAESQEESSRRDEMTELGVEIKKAMKEKEEQKEGGLLGGVAEEIREIEWPAFNKVLGTTGVVLGVIAGSSVVLLTVNAVLAEISDRVFAGRGVQDFFG